MNTLSGIFGAISVAPATILSGQFHARDSTTLDIQE
jgi:hypothetical protein